MAGSSCDLLVVGLGNPGAEYAGTRHNVGAAVVELLADRHGERLRADRLVSAGTARLRLGGHSVVLAVPTTWMNDSGRAVAALVRRHDVEPGEVLVIHDELDLEPGRIKLKVGGGHAGHNGLRSIHSHITSPDYLRVRIGIGKPPGGPQRGADWVLARVGATQRRVLDDAVARAADAVEMVASDGIEAAMQRFHGE
ncbi:MAG: aminoacyl-tRNA hydrolase [Actinomycetota bacterium]|nr:aminoacyl-tRNA hydrolase [Actinomycetota bacterium]